MDVAVVPRGELVRCLEEEGSADAVTRMDAEHKAKHQDKELVACQSGQEAVKTLLDEERHALEYHLDPKELEALEKAALPCQPDQVERTCHLGAPRCFPCTCPAPSLRASACSLVVMLECLHPSLRVAPNILHCICIHKRH